MTTSRVLYKKLSSVVENSYLDDPTFSDSTRGIHDHMIPVVPTKGITDSFRGPTIPPSSKVEKDVETLLEEEFSTPERHWISFVVVYTMIFFNGCCFTAVVPSVPFYLQVLGAAPSFLGWVVSFYSLGQIIGSPTAGFVSNKLSSVHCLTISSSLGLISSILYAIAPNPWWILLSRILTGISAGFEFTTELTFIARNTSTQERTTFLASVTACNVVGFIMGPALTTVLATLDFTVLGLFTVNQYTGPGWLLVIMFGADLFMVQYLFKDKDVSEYLAEQQQEERRTTENTTDLPNGEDHNPTSEQSRLLEKKAQTNGRSISSSSYGGVSQDKPSNGTDNEVDTPSTPINKASQPPSLTMALSLIFVQFTVMCAWSVLETITSPLAYDQFDWNVQECNLLFTCGGFVSLVAYVGFVVASKWVQDRYLIVYALILCFVGLLLMIAWEQLAWTSNGLEMILPSYLHRFIIGYMIMNAGFMTGRPVTFALYSKLIASEYQGKYLGYMVAGGSAARTLGPFGAVYLYYGISGDTGNNLLALFGSEGIFQLICLGLVLALWSTLVPVTAVKEKKSQQDEDPTRNGTIESNGPRQASQQ